MPSPNPFEGLVDEASSLGSSVVVVLSTGNIGLVTVEEYRCTSSGNLHRLICADYPDWYNFNLCRLSGLV